MNAWLLHSQTGLGALELRHDHPTPELAANEVLVRVKFAALNPADRYLAEKAYPANPKFPHILGRDAVGTIERLGAGASKFAPGDVVAVLRGGTGVSRLGTFAEYVAVPEDELVPRPDGWKDEEAACATLVYLTAYQALTQWGVPREGATVLITGATGGVGVASLQLARAMGLRAIALSRSAEKGARLQQLGAGVVIDPTAENLLDRVKEFAGKDRVAVAVDNIGGPLFNKVIATLGDGGAVSCVGRLAGPVPEFNTATLFFRRNKIGGVSVGSYGPQEARDVWDKVLALLARRGDRPVIDSTFPFDQLPAAFARLKEGPLGKVLLRVAG